MNHYRYVAIQTSHIGVDRGGMEGGCLQWSFCLFFSWPQSLFSNQPPSVGRIHSNLPTPVIYALIRERWRRMNRPPLKALHSIKAVLFYDYGCADFGGGGGGEMVIIIVVPGRRVSNSLVAELAALPPPDFQIKRSLHKRGNKPGTLIYPMRWYRPSFWQPPRWSHGRMD